MPVPVLPTPRHAGASRTALLVVRDLGRAVAAGLAEDRHAADVYRAAAAADGDPSPAPRVRSIAARKALVEAWTRDALGAGARQVALLGAGFDTLGPRLAAGRRGLLVVDADLPATLAARGRALAEAGVPLPWPAQVEADLRDPPAVLAGLRGAGWAPGIPGIVVLEAVTEYLPPPRALRAVRTALTLAGPGGRVICTVRLGDALGDTLLAPIAAAGEPMRSFPRLSALPRLVRACGARVLDRRGSLTPAGGSMMLLLAPA